MGWGGLTPKKQEQRFLGGGGGGGGGKTQKQFLGEASQPFGFRHRLWPIGVPLERQNKNNGFVSGTPQWVCVCVCSFYVCCFLGKGFPLLVGFLGKLLNYSRDPS